LAPKNKDDDWQDILQEIDIDILPIEYMNRILIHFKDKTTWDIDIKDSRKKQPVDEIEKTLDDLFEEYDDRIENIDFRMDMERLREDLDKRVKRFLKLNK
jgi:hypothetical protein